MQENTPHTSICGTLFGSPWYNIKLCDFSDRKSVSCSSVSYSQARGTGRLCSWWGHLCWAADCQLPVGTPVARPFLNVSLLIRLHLLIRTLTLLCCSPPTLVNHAFLLWNTLNPNTVAMKAKGWSHRLGVGAVDNTWSCNNSHGTQASPLNSDIVRLLLFYCTFCKIHSSTEQNQRTEEKYWIHSFSESKSQLLFNSKVN